MGLLRYGGGDARNSGIVDEVRPEDELLGAAIEQAAELAGKDRPTVGAIKQTMYSGALDLLRREVELAGIEADPR